MTIRDRIQEVLDEKRELNLTNVALAAGLSNSALHKFMKGSIRSMTVESFEKIAEALGVSSRWLVFGDSPKEPEAKLVYIWDKIAENKKVQALRVLQTFTTDDDESEAG